jgi:Flp pilus assembly protein TadD
MILPLLALAVANPVPAPAAQPLSEAAYALEAGRIDQARAMIGNAVKAGARGPEIDRLLADLAFASGDFAAALAAYRALLPSNPNNARMYEKAGISALRTRAVAEAALLLTKATSLPGASWRAWNARGAAADFQRDWAIADEAYAKAAALAPNRAEVLNNLGWSKLVRGDWAGAIEPLERAAALDPKSGRIAANLELARTATAEDLPKRHPGETDEAWAARLNDAGIIARLQGKTKKAVAAFAQALEARSQWYERAANNLAATERAQ